jgi:dTDP-4-amino-4,6-dideoxygalactose transaminase
MPDRIYLSPPHVTGSERELLLDAFDSNLIAPLGPHVDAFERELCALIGAHSTAALSSGTAALHLALLLAGVERGDYVISSSFTFAATANAIMYCGAEPVFVDSDQSTWNIDPDLLEAALAASEAQGKLPKAAIIVDLYGQCADYDRINDVCARYSVTVIEDAAEALGATYKGRSAGTLAAFSAFSFNGNKIITTGGGGMLVASDPEHTARARFLATQARDVAPHYQHSTIGYNYRMSNLLAAVGRGQLQTLHERIEARRRNFERYESAFSELPGVQFMPEAEYGRSNRWLTCMLIDPTAFGATREEIRLALEAENIEARPLWKPMHLQPAFESAQVFGGSVSARLFESGLCLPSGSSLTTAAQERVIDAVVRCCRSSSVA